MELDIAAKKPRVPRQICRKIIPALATPPIHATPLSGRIT